MAAVSGDRRPDAAEASAGSVSSVVSSCVASRVQRFALTRPAESKQITAGIAASNQLDAELLMCLLGVSGC